jgi:hypothetical protein
MSKKFRPANNYLKSSQEFATIQAKLQQNQDLLQQIQTMLPSPLNEHCIGVVAKPDLLVLYADSSGWASRLRYFSRDLSEKLRKKRLNFNKIQIKIAIDNRHQARKPKQRRTKLLSAKDSDHLMKVANHTSDPGLRAALMRLSSHKRS